MNIVGPDELVFGVEDVEAANQYLIDYGLVPVDASPDGGRFEAMDGTAIVVKRHDDPTLPAPLTTGSTLRQTVYGAADEATLAAIAAELEKDRPVERLPDGSLLAKDDSGFALRFQVTVRRPFSAPAERVNAPGCDPQRLANELGVDEACQIVPRTLSHVVYFVPNVEEAEAFYVNRLGFRCTDRFTEAGPFLQPRGSVDHHTLFLIQTPPFMQGCEHFTFHLGGPTEVMLAGTRMVTKGYTSFWGPGRHKFGSNWFWYFNSPFGCHVEYDADMDLHDEQWIARETSIGADASQAFLFQYAPKWMPGG